ncbi:hypothetical protein LMH87_010924 [Akanthomyces muscarius]|uniref:Uncharacterized protein n=1 Tax=Akanthomyces muscarius TaxID=2231603 RepID=A0A9W8Q8Q6_AKAMU|nr:hypothetical protein LMH87_010924 [Akanthomyces muscarius]KAJ4150161.1 hypothetical protein LMH87_010924 [Akanthomyces muscarius]
MAKVSILFPLFCPILTYFFTISPSASLSLIFVSAFIRYIVAGILNFPSALSLRLSTSSQSRLQSKFLLRRKTSLSSKLAQQGRTRD